MSRNFHNFVCKMIWNASTTPVYIVCTRRIYGGGVYVCKTSAAARPFTGVHRCIFPAVRPQRFLHRCLADLLSGDYRPREWPALYTSRVCRILHAPALSDRGAAPALDDIAPGAENIESLAVLCPMPFGRGSARTGARAAPRGTGCG